MTRQEQAWQSGLVLLDETPEWNFEDWPPLALEGGYRYDHASVVLDHHENDDDNNNEGQTVVVLGGHDEGVDATHSVLVLNLSEPDKQWREGPPMNKRRRAHAAAVCNGGVYVMGGDSEASTWDCLERIDASDLLQSSFTTSSTPTYESPWTTVTCRLSTRKYGCCAVAVRNRYLVVMGGYDMEGTGLSSVDIIDTSNHSVTAGPSMNVPRAWCASAVIGHRIFVVGGENEYGYNALDSVEYLDFAKDDTVTTASSFPFTWVTHSDLVLSDPRDSCAVAAVGSCLVVAGGEYNPTVEVLDTHRNRVWNLPPFGNCLVCCSMVTVANQVAVISGIQHPTCATLSLVDKNSWCFRRLCEQPPNRFREGMGFLDGDISPFSTSTLKLHGTLGYAA